MKLLIHYNNVNWDHKILLFNPDYWFIKHLFINDLLISLTRWCLFFWLFAESNLVLEFRLFVFQLFHDLL